MNAVALSFQDVSGYPHTPEEQLFEHWAAQISPLLEKDIEVCLRIVDTNEMTSLNEQYRAKKGATNVLTFVADIPKQVDTSFAGDIVICAEVVEQEAKLQGKDIQAHWAHLVIHGFLHMLGYDHIDEQDAEEMEALETKFITGLNYPAPYVLT